jgi:cysteine desulfurase
LHGGGHERGLRPGTLPVPLIVGFGVAAQQAQDDAASGSQRVRELRDRLWEGLRERVEGVTLNGPPLDGPRLPNNLNLSFEAVEGEALMMAIRDIAVSSGSACTSATLEPSHVLRAMGVPDDVAHASIRFGLGRFNTTEEVDFVVQRLATEIPRLRAMSPRYGSD